MTDLFLIRHGIAADLAPQGSDFERPLTEAGMQRTRQVAKRLKALGLEFSTVLTSPLLRAKQTAQLLLEAQLANTLEISPDLAPGGSLADWVIWFQRWQQQGGTHLALVGHQPNLGQWAEWLCWGESRNGHNPSSESHLVVKKAGVIGVQVPASGDLQGQGMLFWLTPPKLLL